MSNSTDANYEQVNPVSLLLGVGAEYAMRNGLGIRGEFISFDGDAQYAQLALIYRFGADREQAEPTPVVEPEPEPVVKVVPKVVEPVVVPEPEPKPVEKPVYIPRDDDRDGVENLSDKCPRTPTGTPVGVDGCEIFNGIIDGVTFELSSANLTAESIVILENAVKQLLKFPSVRIQIDAHTDSDGDEAFNLKLSRQRVVAVANYFIKRGVAKSRLAGRAYGETRPIASNNTPEGKQKNRRVELKSIQ